MWDLVEHFFNSGASAAPTKAWRARDTCPCWTRIWAWIPLRTRGHLSCPEFERPTCELNPANPSITEVRLCTWSLNILCWTRLSAVVSRPVCNTRAMYAASSSATRPSKDEPSVIMNSCARAERWVHLSDAVPSLAWFEHYFHLNHWMQEFPNVCYCTQGALVHMRVSAHVSRPPYCQISLATMDISLA